MQSDVFSYFVAIGAGLSVGITLGLIPGYLLLQWLRRDKGAIKKASRSRS